MSIETLHRRRGGPEAVRDIIAAFKDTPHSAYRRMVLAHMLAESENPEAIEALKAAHKAPKRIRK